MDHKTWLWKRKSGEKTLDAAERVNLPSSASEAQILQTDVAAMEMDVKIVNEKLSSALSESNAKEDIVKKQTKLAQEAIAGWEKAGAEAISLKQELEKALKQSIAGEERSIKLDAALKECMQQLRFVREDQEKRIHDAVMKASKEFEHMRFMLEEKLAETSKRLAKSGAENTELSETLLAKEKMIEDLNEQKAQAEANYSSLMTRLESVEKGNYSLKYEVRVLEKELEIRNEEREFNRRTAEIAHKQQLESVKKIAKLESECQRLRLLVRKRFPGPAALAKMKSEVEMLGRDPAEARRRKSNFCPTALVDFSVDNAPDTASKKINFLMEQLIAMEEENQNFKESLNNNTTELQLSRTTYTCAASKLSQIETQLEESSINKVAVEPARILPPAQEIPVASLSDMGKEDQASIAETWASALISELEHFRSGKQADTPSCRTVGSLDMNLMDDFVEMEKLATESVVEPSGSSRFASDEGNDVINPMENQSARYLEAAVKERVISNSLSDLSMSMHQIIELIEAISAPFADHNSMGTFSGKDDRFLPYQMPDTSTGYMVRLFQWKTSELHAVLQHFVQSCHDLLEGKVGIQKFVEELTSALQWIVNHCFSLQDVSSMRDAIKKHFDLDDSRSESDIEGVMINHIPEADKLNISKEWPPLPMVSSWKVRNNPFHVEEIQPSVEVESRSFKHELENMESLKKDLEGRLQLEIYKSESLSIQLQESETTIKTLQKEVETLKKSKGMMEDQIEKEKMVKEDLDSQLKAANVGLNEACKKILTLEKVVEDKNNGSKELEATCVDLNLQLESFTRNIPKSDMEHEDKQLRPGWEIMAASEKLAECQETILNLGKQLKALAPPRDAALFDKVITSPPPTDNHISMSNPKRLNRRSSLLDKMLADDTAETEIIKSPRTKEVICNSDAFPLNDRNSFASFSQNGSIITSERLADVIGIKHLDNENEVKALAMMPSKKKRRLGFLKKLFWGRKKKQQQGKMFP